MSCAFLVQLRIVFALLRSIKPYGRHYATAVHLMVKMETTRAKEAYAWPTTGFIQSVEAAHIRICRSAAEEEMSNFGKLTSSLPVVGLCTAFREMR